VAVGHEEVGVGREVERLGRAAGAPVLQVVPGVRPGKKDRAPVRILEVVRVARRRERTGQRPIRPAVGRAAAASFSGRTRRASARSSGAATRRAALRSSGATTGTAGAAQGAARATTVAAHTRRCAARGAHRATRWTGARRTGARRRSTSLPRGSAPIGLGYVGIRSSAAAGRQEDTDEAREVPRLRSLVHGPVIVA
jgi:hypothetical protein